MSDEFKMDKVFGRYLEEYLPIPVMAAMTEYTGSAYEQMNRITRYGKLRNVIAPLSKGQREDGLTTVRDKLQDITENIARINVIKEYFKESTPYVPLARIILYRRIQSGAIHKLKKEKTLIDKGFTSTTMSLYVAPSIGTVDTGKGGYTVRLHMLPGIPYKLYPVKYQSAVKFEEEVLFDLNMKYYLCEPVHKMQIVETDHKCVDVLDCIFIPSEYSYLLEGEWYKHWCSIINAENKYVFNDILTTNCYRYDKYVFHFIQEIEYLMQKTIWKNREYTNKPLFQPDAFDAIANLLKEGYENTSTTRQLTEDPYLKSTTDNIVRRCMEFAEKLPKNHFRYTNDWLNFINTKVGGVASASALQILTDLNALLKAVDGPQCANAVGLKKEIRKSIRNVNALGYKL